MPIVCWCTTVGTTTTRYAHCFEELQLPELTTTWASEVPPPQHPLSSIHDNLSMPGVLLRSPLLLAH